MPIKNKYAKEKLSKPITSQNVPREHILCTRWKQKLNVRRGIFLSHVIITRVTAEYPATSKLYHRNSWVHGYAVCKQISTMVRKYRFEWIRGYVSCVQKVVSTDISVDTPTDHRSTVDISIVISVDISVAIDSWSTVCWQTYRLSICRPTGGRYVACRVSVKCR